MMYSIFDFTLNNAQFTQKYCENKDKPAMKCDGKCKLAKIAKETEKQTSGNTTSKENEIVFFLQPIEKVQFTSCFLDRKPIVTQCTLHGFNSSQDNFHPPKCYFSFS